MKSMAFRIPRHIQRCCAKATLKPFSCSIFCLPTLRFEERRANYPSSNTNRNRAYLQQFSYHSHSLARAPSSLADATIYALSTGNGRAGIAIVRISGSACLDIYRKLCPLQAVPKPRYATLRTLYDPEINSDILDSDSLVLYFPSPKTVTGEEVLELHVHGGPATVKSVLAAIPRCSSDYMIRYAEPGEFTRRAFQNDRLDLAQVEALSDTLSAETEQQRRAAVRGNSGKLGRTYEQWRQQLLYARGELEALIDFSEDQHFDESPSQLMKSITSQIQAMLSSIKIHQEASHRGELLQRGIRISLIGPPNAGKSSLLNQIVGREASIVSSEAGTTRDIVEVSLDIRGYLCTFADTAGLRDAEQYRDGERKSTQGRCSDIGEVELEGIRRAKISAGESDVVIALAYCSDTKTASDDKIPCIFDQGAIEIAMESQHSLIVVNKFDSHLFDKEDIPRLDFAAQSQPELTTALPQNTKYISQDMMSRIHTISCKDAKSISVSERNDPGNIKALVESLVKIFEQMTVLPADLADLIGVTARQRQLLTTCAGHLELFVAEAQNTDEECDIVLAAEHLRSAADCISRITGRGEAGDVEEVLGVVFEKFCVGK